MLHRGGVTLTLWCIGKDRSRQMSLRQVGIINLGRELRMDSLWQGRLRLRGSSLRKRLRLRLWLRRIKLAYHLSQSSLSITSLSKDRMGSVLSFENTKAGIVTLDL